jgi:signal transduction histidine kinase
LGVLFAGQIIVTEKVPSWKDALAGHDSHVKWDSFNANHQDQTQDIFGAIEHTVEDPTKPTLYDLLKETPKLPLKDFESRIQDFFQFGKMMTSLLARSYRLTVLAEQQRLLHGLAVELVKKTSHPNHWWINLANLLGQMYEATDAYPVDIYSREQSDYVLKIEGREVVNTHEARHVPVRTCIDFPTDELAKISELDSPADVAALFQAVPSAYIFKCDLAGVDAGDTSTIIVLHRTEVVGHWKDFATAFCEVVGLRSDISANLQQIVQDRESFGKRVRNVSHSAKTPLQRALARLNSARVMRRGDDVFRELTPGVLKLLQQDILDAKAELAELYAGMARPRTRANLRSLLSRLENEMRPLAIAKDCTIDLRLPDEEMWVNMCEAEIRIALRNLLDNAIKYSFGGHDIRMVARVVQNKTVEILFHNFGLGIPENLIQAIRYEGQRAKVVDRAKGTRSGMGLGLPIAIGFLEPHGGSFDINSRASDPHPREAYHRWITEAIVTLPLMGAMQANE